MAARSLAHSPLPPTSIPSAEVVLLAMSELIEEVRSKDGTGRNVPWDGNVPFFLGEFVTAAGEPHPLCPRRVAQGDADLEPATAAQHSR